MLAPQPFPYQGSKRRLASAIIGHLPRRVARVIEPFAGSAAVSLACAAGNRASAFVLGDLNAPLCALWQRILLHPRDIASAYESLWLAQQGRERDFYNEVRDQFNETGEPELLLYLLARCVKASVRYNARGEFNQSPDHRRKGMRPATMRANLQATSRLLSARTQVVALEYREVLAQATSEDIVYMDPPYQGVCGNRDPRYIEGVAYEVFASSLADLNRRQVPFIVSYDGRLGSREYGRPLPASLRLVHIELNAGRSTQATLLGEEHVTYESLYLSPALVDRHGRFPMDPAKPKTAQLVLPEA